MPVECKVKRGIEEGMAGAYESSECFALRCDEGFLKGDALIAWEHRFTRSDHAVTIAYRRGNMSDFVAARLALPNCATELRECLKKK